MEVDMDKKSYASIPQAAKILRKSRIAVFKQVKKGNIDAVRIGKNYMVPKSFLKKMILNKTIKDIERDINNAIKKAMKEFKNILELIE